MRNKVKAVRLADGAERYQQHAGGQCKTRGNAWAWAILIMLLSNISIDAYAAPATDKEPLQLRQIMRDLGKNMQAATDSISHEDWARVAAIARAIADHPQPPISEKLRILAYIGSNVPRFRAFDGQTHDAANSMANAAARKDGAGVIAAFADIQSGCLACHQTFRKAFVEHFYGSP